MSFWKSSSDENPHSWKDIAFLAAIFIPVALITSRTSKVSPLWKDVAGVLGIVLTIGYLGYVLWHRKHKCGGCLIRLIWGIIILGACIYELFS